MKSVAYSDWASGWSWVSLFDPRNGQEMFLYHSVQLWGGTQLPVECVPLAFSWVKRLEREADYSPSSVPGLRIRGNRQPASPFPIHIFMVLCLIKYSDNFTLYVT
jgi:hypothetical protein